tara:strand:+ start:5055 stop:5495 length:441 start_codon:yes stop_codon:yes gene_type:complete
MSKVIEIAICENFGREMRKVDSVESIAGKGLLKDRHYKDNNEKKSQITFIELENIKHYNFISGTSILPKDFRRNIVTEGVKLNELVGKEFFVGEVKVKGHDLCRPCKHLQELLEQKNLIKEMLYKSGLRCEILTSGKIFVGSEIKF